MTASPRRRVTSRRGAREAGSVFIESIVAAAIVAMALGGTCRVIADNAARERAAEARRTALLVAQSALADVGVDTPLALGDSVGAAGDMAWRVTVSPYGEEDKTNPAGDLVEVSVAVAPRSGGRPLVTLRELRLLRTA
jgi:general secretion pathway protein I